MSSDLEPAALPPSIIPQKRSLDDDHSPAVSSPLNPDVKAPEPQPQPPDEAPQPSRSKTPRIKKDSFKKREAKAADSAPDTPHARLAAESEARISSPLRYKLAPPKPSDFEPPRGPLMTLHHQVSSDDGEAIDFLETSEHVANKKNFRYTHCVADPLFPCILYYRQSESPPFGPRISFEDAASQVFFDKTARIISTDKGFRMARANVAVRQGRWYWECRIRQGIGPAKDASGKLQTGKHVRMGWARREASLEAPVGFDAYSYGIRDVSGEKVHMSRPKEFFPPGQGIRQGDVIGLEIRLPSEHLQRKVMTGNYNPAVDAADDEAPPPTEASNIVRDRVPIRFKAHTYFEKIEYHSTKELEDLMNPSSLGPPPSSSEAPNPNHALPALRTLPKSYIKIYKNGLPMGTLFQDLLAFLPPASKPMPQVGAREGLDDGMLGYYPAVSVFRGGAADVNFGPDFWCPPPEYSSPAGADSPSSERMRPLSERFGEQIAEDIVYDIVDEVDFWMQDGGGSLASMGAAREEIKELVQDD